MLPCSAHSWLGIQACQAHASCRGNACFQKLHSKSSPNPAEGRPLTSHLQAHPCNPQRCPESLLGDPRECKRLSFPVLEQHLTLFVTKECPLSLQSARACGTSGAGNAGAVAPEDRMMTRVANPSPCPRDAAREQDRSLPPMAEPDSGFSAAHRGHMGSITSPLSIPASLPAWPLSPLLHLLCHLSFSSRAGSDTREPAGPAGAKLSGEDPPWSQPQVGRWRGRRGPGPCSVPVPTQSSLKVRLGGPGASPGAPFFQRLV